MTKYLHDIGNLTLTYDNSSYSNKPFPAKRGAAGATAPCYATSKLFAEQELAAINDWTEAEILARRRTLMDWAIQRWAINDPNLAAGEITEEESVEENT